MAAPDAAVLLDVLEVESVEYALELLDDVRAAVKAARLRGLTARLTAASRVLGDLEAPVPAWVSAAVDVLEVAETAGMPGWGTPRALREFVLLALERDVFPETAVVRRRRRGSVGLDARLAEVRREADVRLTAAGARVLPRTPARLGELDRRAQLSGWALRERAA